MKHSPEQLLEIYDKLPKDVQDAIFSVDSADAIQAIGKKYNLTIDKVGELADETGLVMLGLTHPNDFIPNLTGRLKTDKETAGKIAGEINSQIFVKIRESLRKIYEAKEVSEKPVEKTGEVSEKDKIRHEILTEIEKKEEPTNPFEAKMKEDVLRIPPVEKKYTGEDPYREPIE